jgi:hypothetical protein
MAMLTDADRDPDVGRLDAGDEKSRRARAFVSRSATFTLVVVPE